MQRLHAMLTKSNRTAIRVEFCKNETVNLNVSFRNNAPAELCYRDVHDNSHHCLGTMFIVWIHDFRNHVRDINGPNNNAVNFAKKTNFLGKEK